jgi:hypothetical protein
MRTTRTKFPPKCACGCGEFVNRLWDGSDGWNKFVRWHHSRAMTQEHKDKIAVTLTGFKASDETRRKLSLMRKGIIFTELHKQRLSEASTGKNNHKWKGGRYDADGYVMVYCPDHPNLPSNTSHIQEHRLVMEKSIGRYLLITEIVHHKNEIKDDNRIENLEIKTQTVHFTEHEVWRKRRCFDEKL